MKLWIMLLIAMTLPAAAVQAEEPVLQKTKPAGTSTIIRLDSVNAKVNALESRIQELERDRRYQDDRVRSLERSVEDLKRQIRS